MRQELPDDRCFRNANVPVVDGNPPFRSSWRLGRTRLHSKSTCGFLSIWNGRTRTGGSTRLMRTYGHCQNPTGTTLEIDRSGVGVPRRLRRLARSTSRLAPRERNSGYSPLIDNYETPSYSWTNEAIRSGALPRNSSANLTLGRLVSACSFRYRPLKGVGRRFTNTRIYARFSPGRVAPQVGLLAVFSLLLRGMLR